MGDERERDEDDIDPDTDPEGTFERWLAEQEDLFARPPDVWWDDLLADLPLQTAQRYRRVLGSITVRCDR